MLRSIAAVLLLSVGLALPPARAGEAVVLQLKWQHAYQFEGYYMARELGYYRDAGLDVEIRAGGPGIDFVGEVVAGRAQYGTGSSGLVLDRNQGRPVVALATIFQHSPDVLMTARSSGLASPQQLAGKRVMTNFSTPAIAAMLLNEAGSLGKFHILDQTNDLDGLIQGKVDAIAGYATDQPFFFHEHGFPIHLIQPIQYGVDFYGDTLFTSEAELKRHPERVRAFRAASLKCWEYAMAHPDPTIEAIQRYGSASSTEHLWFEYRAMLDLLLPQFIEIGHMNPGRWQHIADAYVRLGQLKPDYSLKGFLYDPGSAAIDLARLKRYLALALGAVILAAGIIALLVRFTRQLKAEIRERGLAEQRLNEAQRIAQIGSWEGDLRTGRSVWSDEEFLLLGYRPGEVEPSYEAFLAAVHPEDRQGVMDALDAACRAPDDVYRAEFRAAATHGALHYLVERGRIELDEAGQPLRVLGTTLDITEARLAESTIRESEALLRTLGSNLPGGAIYQIVTEPDGQRHLSFISESIDGLLGVTAAAVMEDVTRLYASVHPDDRQRVAEAEERAARELVVFACEIRILHRDGTEKWISARSSPRPRPGGGVIWDGVMVDISSRVAAEESLAEERAQLEVQVEARTAELRQRERDLKTILDNVPAMIGYWDKDLYNRFANWAYWDWFGVEPSMLPGRHISGLLGEAIYARNRPYIEAVLRGEPQVF